MAVVGVVVTTLDADPEGVWRLPVAAQEGHIDALKHSRERPAGGAGTSPYGLTPDQVERGWPAAQGQITQFIPCEDRLREATGQPEHFRSGARRRVRVRVIKGTGWSLEVQAKITGMLKAGKR